MRFTSLSLIVFLLVTSATIAAEDKGDASAPMPKDQKEFIEKSSRLTSLTNRIAEHDKNFLAAVRAKAATKDPAEKRRLIQVMLEIKAQRDKDVEAFNRIKTELKLRYPNQGEHLERRYQTQTKKSLEEMEGAAGLDELLTRIKKVIDRKYAPFIEPKEDEKSPAPKTVKTQEQKPERIRIER